MHGGLTPEEACKKMIERIVSIKKDKVKDIQVAFLAISHRRVLAVLTYLGINPKDSKPLE